MTEGTKTRRLSKVAKEFNIGLTTIVDFLNKKGISVANNPNAKIPQEAYELLFQEFQSEKTLKEATRKAGLGILKRESISIDKDKEDEDAKTQQEEEKDADEDVADVKATEKPEEAEEKKEEVSEDVTPSEEKPGLKVVGKIPEEELGDKKAAKKKKEKAEEEEAADVPKPEEKPEEITPEAGDPDKKEGSRRRQRAAKKTSKKRKKNKRAPSKW